MARVYITVAGSDASAYEELRRRAALDRFGVHTLEEEPSRADLLLFAEYAEEPYLDALRRHPLARAYRERAFCVCERDHTVPFLPGVYTAVPRRWHRRDRVRSGSYHVMYRNAYVAYRPLAAPPPYLYSFVGSYYTAAVRGQIGALRYPRAYVEDHAASVIAHFQQEGDPLVRGRMERLYAAVMRDSAFALCPRGFAPSSVRLFDAMRAGRAPVVLADAWVPPEGPDWDAFCLRVPEADVHRLPALLERHEPEAAARGEAARAAWEAWFSPEASFHRIVEWCLDIRATRRLPERVLRWTALWQLAHQPYRYTYYRHLRARLGARRAETPAAAYAGTAARND
jgi:hypothetical protein